MIDKICGHWLYAVVVVFIIMPINGKIIFQQDQWLLGASLVSLHVPWFISNILKRNMEK